MILALIRPYLQPILAGALALALVFGGVQTWRLKGAQADAAKSQLSSVVHEANATVLEDAVETQTQAVEQLAEKQAADTTSRAKRATQVLEQKPVPHAPGADALNRWLETQ